MTEPVWREARVDTGDADGAAPGAPGPRWRRVPPGFRRVVLRELARMRTRPLYPLLMLVLPLAGWLVLLATFGARTPRDLPVAVVDRDHTALSRKVTRALDAAPGLRVVARPATPAAAEDRLLHGDAYAVVVLAEDLERGVLRGEAPPVLALYNAQWLLPGKLIARDLNRVVATVSAGLEIRARRVSATASAAAVEPIRPEAHPLFNPGLDYAEFLLTALVPALLQIFVLVLGVHAVGSELRQESAGRWLEAAGGRVSRALAGKLLPYAAWFTLLMLALTAATYRILGVPVRGSTALVAVGLALLALAVLGMAVLLVGWTANLRLSTSLASFLAVPAFAFSGITFPLSAMPPVARAWAGLLPLTHFLRLQTQQLVVGAPARASAAPAAALLALALGLPALAAWRFPRLLRDPSLWGRA